MEMPEFSSREQKPELDRSRPEAFFSYAAAKQRWLRSRISPQQISDALDDHALSLWAHIRDEYDDFPEVEVTTKNAYHTKGVAVKKATDAGEELYSFGSEKLPLTGDAGLFGVHELRGRLYDFYRADNDEIRLYISTDAEEVKTPGGVYTPRISVSLEHSDIQFAEFGAKARMGVFENEVQAQLEHVTSDIIIRSLIEIRSALSSEATTCAQIQKAE